MMCGYFPLADDIDDPYDVYRAIVNNEIEYPEEDLTDIDELAMLKQLLDK